MKNYREKLAAIRAIGGEASDSEESTVLRSKIGDASGSMGAAQSAFNEYKSANAERTRVFTDFEVVPDVDNKDQFYNMLTLHLSQNIVVKESRNRYQREQFLRLIFATNDRHLMKKSQSLENFCVAYSQLIEGMIDESHNFMSPKIQANYDSYDEATVRPINSTIFYYFFSGNAMSRWFSQWLLASVRYPNERVKRSYMRFFA